MDTKSTITPEEVVGAFLAACNNNDLDAVMDCLDDDFVKLGESTNPLPLGKETYRDMWTRFAIAFPDFKRETICMVVAGDTVAIDVIETGTFTGLWAWQGKTLRPTGKRYRAKLCVFFRVNAHGLIQCCEEEGVSIANRAPFTEQPNNSRSAFGASSASFGRHAWEQGVKLRLNRFF